jgi:hypothetical protein
MTFKLLVWSVHLRMPIRRTGSSCSSSKPGRGKSRLLSFLCNRGLNVPSQASARALEPEIVSRLARFFPEATPVRIPIRLSRARNHENGNHGHEDNSNEDSQNEQGNGHSPHDNGTSFLQETVIEFGTPHEVLFTTSRPLEFADRVLIESKDGSLRAEASVVAVQYHPARTVVAVRFLKPVPNWIVKS